MVRKISFLILSIAILVIGIIGFNKLSYWDRSVRIFSFNSAVPFEGREGRGPGGRGFEGTEGQEGRERFNRQERSGEGRTGQVIGDRNIPESLRQQFGALNGVHHDNYREERGPSEGRFGSGEGRERGEFRNGEKINLRNVKWFLAVFASLTLIVIYLDIAYILLCKKNRQ